MSPSHFMLNYIIPLHLMGTCYCTVDIYEYSWGCTPVSLDHSYMGGPAQRGNQLSMTINEQPLDEFKGFTPSKDRYSVHMKSVHDWNQYLLFVDKGKLQSSKDYHKTACDGKRLMIEDLELDVYFTWIPGDDLDETATITVGYAPHYTTIWIQEFAINPHEITKSEL